MKLRNRPCITLVKNVNQDCGNISTSNLSLLQKCFRCLETQGAEGAIQSCVADRGSTDDRVSPVDEDLICRTVVLDLVHADPGDVVLWGPPDGGGAGREI